jgi:uncharacterized protein related to proFAR isomerase
LLSALATGSTGSVGSFAINVGDSAGFEVVVAGGVAGAEGFTSSLDSGFTGALAVEAGFGAVTGLATDGGTVF